MKLVLVFLALAQARPDTCPAPAPTDPTAQLTREWTNEPGRPLILVTVPKKSLTYYQSSRDVLIDFHVQYAKTVVDNPSTKRDNAIITGDAETIATLKTKLDHKYHDILLEADLDDIWMRDPSPASMTNQVSFKLAANYIKSQTDKDWIQNKFESFLAKYGASNSKHVSLKMDAGNVVDNFGTWETGKSITTKRYCKDNNIPCDTVHWYTGVDFGKAISLANSDMKEAQMEAVRAKLRSVLNYSHVALILDQGDTTGHADGIVAWMDKDVLAVYPPETGHDALMSELNTQLPGTKIIEFESVFSDDNWQGFTSACGVHVNALTTFDNVYVPVFAADPATKGQSKALDEKIEGLIKSNSCKNVLTIQVPNAVCRMGGSVRCLSWQAVGANADKLVMAARSNRT